MTETPDPEITEQQVADAQADDTDTDAEPDSDDGEQDAEPDAEPDSEPAPAESYADMEAIGKKLDQLGKHVARRMGEILGEDAQLLRSCMCSEIFNMPGWLPPVDPPADAQAFMYHWLGQHSPTDYLHDEHSAPCRHCNGLGEVATGSKVLGQDRLPCVDCKGLGWSPTDNVRSSGLGQTSNGPSAAAPGELPAVPLAPPEPDTPEVADLKARGYVVIPPYTATR